MTYYSKQEIDRLREDAIRRTQEMYSRSRSREIPPSENFSEEFSPPPLQYIPPPVSQNPPPHMPPPENPPPFMPQNPSPFANILSGKKLDKDSLILLGLLYLLYKENADKKLLLAILYIFF
ncbi:MAG: hypothetical protein LBM93_06760 [Oscillospiraceae bacterium]|nr:hypothetical protein [Oscillospiraceae bacterium]